MALNGCEPPPTHRSRSNEVLEDVGVTLNHRQPKMINGRCGVQSVYWKGFMDNIQPDHIVPTDEGWMSGIQGNNHSGFNFH